MISVGVDVGTYSIKIAEVEATSKSYIIRKVLEIPLSLDPNKDRKIQVIDALRTLFAQYDQSKTHFIFGLEQKSISTRLMHFPFRERFKVQKAVVSQLDDELPFAIEEAVFDAHIVAFKGKGSEVLAMAAPKTRVAETLNLAHDCGIEPVLISSESCALSNLFERWWEPPIERSTYPTTPVSIPEGAETPPAPDARDTDLILNIGHQTTELLVYSENILIGVRNIDWGAKHIADTIAQKYGINYIQAINELQSKGFVLLAAGQGTKEQLAFSQTIEKGLAPMISDLRLKMLELQSEMNLRWIKGSLVGGGSNLRNLGAYLTQAIEIPFNKFKQFDIHPTMNAEVNPHIESVTCVAVGLALEGLKRPRNPATNFLKAEFAKQSHFFETLVDRWGYTAKIAAIAFVILMVYGLTRESFSQRLMEESDNALRVQAKAIAGLDGKAASPGKIQKFISVQEKEAANRKSAQSVVRLNSAMDVLNALSAAIPKNQFPALEIKRFAVDNDQVEIHGYSSSAGDNLRILQALKSLSRDGKIDSTNPNIKAPAGKTAFAARFRVVRLKGG